MRVGKKARLELKRNDEELAAPATSSVLAATLPDEVLVQIFGLLDSVSRKRSERVCHRWQAILRDTLSLRVDVLVDTSYLATATSICSTCTAEKLPARLGRTVVALLTDNILAQTLHITGESDVTKPWLINTFMELHHPGFTKFLPELSKALRGGGIIVTKVVLEKLVFPAWNMNHFIEKLFSAPSSIRSLELRDICVQHLSFDSLTGANHACTRFVSDQGVRFRHMRFGQIKMAQQEPAPLVQWMARLGADEPPLTNGEDDICRQTIGSIESYVIYQFFPRYLGRQVCDEDIVIGVPLPHLVKRLICQYAPWIVEDGEDADVL